MAKHPLDISNFLGGSAPEEPKAKKSITFKPKQQTNKPTPQASFSKRPQRSHSSEPEEAQQPRIEKKYWDQLNPESRKIFTSRMWKSIDFNPMLKELTDLSKLTEKWLRWAIPTFANGMKGGPIKDWIDGQRGETDFHYVLVGEHLKHLKEIRQKKKQEQASTPQEEPKTVQSSTEPDNVEQENTEPVVAAVATTDSVEEATQPVQEESPELKMALNELDDHIQWFQNYLDANPLKDDL